MQTKKIEPSYRQQAVYDNWENTDKNLLIEAVAGSGKTTVLLEVLKKCKGETLFLAFNKSIQLEIQEHILYNGIKESKSMTLHALGFLGIRDKYKVATLNNSKYFDISNKVKDAHAAIFDKMNNGDKFKVGQMLVNMNKASRIFMTDDFDEIILYMISMDNIIHESPHLPRLWEYYMELRELSYEDDGNGIIIDFIDMIYLPVKFDLYLPVKPKFILIDEAQDLSTIQHTLIDKLLNQGDVKRWVAVGDRNQSIYGFSGSHSTSFDLFKERDNVIELPLDICYRCSESVLGEANKVYNVMKGFKTEKGVVSTISDPKLVKDGSMVICRNTAPLFEMYFKLVAVNKQVYMKGEDIEARILNFLKSMRFDTLTSLRTKVKKKINELRESKNPIDNFQAAKLEENLESIQIMIRGGLVGPKDKVELLISKLNIIFKETVGAIKLCTIHKSKGLESEVVYILDEHLIPSKWAKSQMQLIQEENLRYVARSRAKSELHYLNSIDEVHEPIL